MATTDWTHCSWDGRPAIYKSTEAHACLDGKSWTPFHPAEVGNDAKVMTQAAFEKAYPDLPPFPGSTPAQSTPARDKAAA